MFAMPQLRLFFLSLFISSLSFSMERPENEPIRYSKKSTTYSKRSYKSNKDLSDEEDFSYDQRSYKPKGYFSYEETIDPLLVEQIIDQAPDYIKLFIDTIQDPNEMLRNFNLQRLLLYGPPGTGKTLLAKAIGLTTFKKYYFLAASSFLTKWKNSQEDLDAEVDFLAQHKEPISIIFDELNLITDQYKNKNSSDSAMPAAFCSMLDRCKRSFPHFLFIGTTNNKENDFPPQLLSRFGKISRVCIPNPNFEIRIQVIYSCLKDRKHILSENDIVDFAQRMDGRTCRDIETIINGSVIFAPKNNKIITPREIRISEEENPYEPSEEELLARKENVPVEEVTELFSIDHILERRHTIIDYLQKKSSFNQANNHHNANLAQANVHHNANQLLSTNQHNASQLQANNHHNINHAQALASFNQTANHHNASQLLSTNQHNASQLQAANHHNINHAQSLASFNQQAQHHNASLAQANNHHNVNHAQSLASFNQQAQHHNASLAQANNHHMDTNHRQDIDTMVDGVTSGVTNGFIGGVMGGLPGIALGFATGIAPSGAKVYARNNL